MKPRTVLVTVVALASVPMMFVGGCLILAIGAGVANYQDDVADRETAAADSRFQRPLESTSGRILFIAQRDGTDDFHVVNGDGSGLTQLTHLPKGSRTTRPIVSPDQTRMVINTGGGVSILPLDRPGEPVRLDRHAGWLAWSPDGKQLASLSIDAREAASPLSRSTLTAAARSAISRPSGRRPLTAMSSPWPTCCGRRTAGAWHLSWTRARPTSDSGLVIAISTSHPRTGVASGTCHWIRRQCSFKAISPGRRMVAAWRLRARTESGSSTRT